MASSARELSTTHGTPHALRMASYHRACRSSAATVERTAIAFPPVRAAPRALARSAILCLLVLGLIPRHTVAASVAPSTLPPRARSAGASCRRLLFVPEGGSGPAEVERPLCRRGDSLSVVADGRTDRWIPGRWSHQWRTGGLMLVAETKPGGPM
jgi:hypothetical protein